MFIVKHRNIFFGITGILVLLSIASVITFGLKPSLEFTGGTLVQVTYVNGRSAP
jgi:preprotein translocase subunit SecF